MANGKRLLIVDDDLELLELLRVNFTRKGYEVVLASDGPKGLLLAQTKSPDLILLDVMLPGMDGYHVAHELMRTSGEPPPKILIMSGRSMDKETPVAILSGAIGVFQKPLDIEALSVRVAELIGAEAPGKN